MQVDYFNPIMLLILASMQKKKKDKGQFQWRHPLNQTEDFWKQWFHVMVVFKCLYFAFGYWKLNLKPHLFTTWAEPYAHETKWSPNNQFMKNDNNPAQMV